jgi:mRNA-degrading endonuclease RelE of RelBE toxin-antitoxin system
VTAVAEFITGQLLDNPLRVGHPLRDEYEGQYSARCGGDWRIPLSTRQPCPDRGRSRHPPSCKKLLGRDTSHIRVANTYRVIYEIPDQVLLVTVVDVGHRREIYR